MSVKMAAMMENVIMAIAMVAMIVVMMVEGAKHKNKHDTLMVMKARRVQAVDGKANSFLRVTLVTSLAF